MKRRRILCAATASLATFPVWAQDNFRRTAITRTPTVGKLSFGLITPRNAEQMLKNWNPFLDRMSAALGLPIERLTYASASELVSDFASGRLQLAWLGNAPALEIVEGGHASVFAVEMVQGKAAYKSTLITHRDSPLRSLDDVHKAARQLTFGDGDVKSTSGHIVPRYFAFVRRGVNDPDKMFREIRRGSHESNLLATARKEVDVATNNTSELDNFRGTRPQEAALVRVIWESPEIPTSPMLWRNDLPLPLKQKIAAFTFGFGRDEEEKAILWNINKLTAWRKSSNRQLVPIADLEMFNARQRVMNDASLSGEQRLAQVDDITRRGSRLELMLKTSSQGAAGS
ncbi:MAG: phosphate/phosphite/phosphonate ABC transporter substrate-binding protein [Burkholderiales bacterium]|nr:phosphate/phosphite/phosphonate ABC transporter substrate-binding protein [Burkholderiales bacterium]